MRWNIVTDSSCDIRQLHEIQGDTEVCYTDVPFIISVEGRDFVDNASLNRDEMLDVMESSRHASHTACPSPHTWYEAFSAPGNVIAVTISKELSGSYNSAVAGREMVLEEHPDKNILIVNSASAGSGLICLVRKITQLILQGKTFPEIAAEAQRLTDEMNTIFALCSFDNLIKNGRMSRIAGFIARHLGFWGIGVASPEGRIVIKGKERSTKKVLAAFLADLGSHNAPSYISISHCQNPEMAQRTEAALREAYPDATIEITDTKGLCSYYAERHGLIIAYV